MPWSVADYFEGQLKSATVWPDSVQVIDGKLSGEFGGSTAGGGETHLGGLLAHAGSAGTREGGEPLRSLLRGGGSQVSHAREPTTDYLS